VRVQGAAAVRWMTLLRPVMGSRRQAQIDRALACYAPRPVALLSDETARVALEELAAGATVKAVASRFGVSIWCIYDLRLGRTFKHLPRERTNGRGGSPVAYQPPFASHPPSTAISLPVMKDAAPDARKATTRATSAGSA
jgi:hypothetical protein